MPDIFAKARDAVSAAAAEATRIAGKDWMPYGGLWEDAASDVLYDRRAELGSEVYETAQKMLSRHAQEMREELYLGRRRHG